jgi:hypothetical protein
MAAAEVVEGLLVLIHVLRRSLWVGCDRPVCFSPVLYFSTNLNVNPELLIGDAGKQGTFTVGTMLAVYFLM